MEIIKIETIMNACTLCGLQMKAHEKFMCDPCIRQMHAEKRTLPHRYGEKGKIIDVEIPSRLTPA